MDQIKKYSLLEMREKTGKSASSVARLCNVTYQSLRNWETGVTAPNIVNIQDLLEIYGFTFQQLDLSPYYENEVDKIRRQKEIDASMDNSQRRRLHRK